MWRCLPAALLAFGCLHSAACRAPSPLADGVDLADQRASARVLAQGKHEYDQYCRACHGDDGRGDGPASLGMHPPPRDFTSAQFKYGWVVDGLPADDDLRRIVQQGLHGTAMRPWTVPDRSLDAILRHVKTFDREEWRRAPVGRPVEPPPDPWGGSRAAEAIARGSAVYHVLAECHSCHPAYVPRKELLIAAERGDRPATLRPDLHEPVSVRSEYRHRGRPVPLVAPDFTWHVLRSVRDGSRRDDLYRVIGAGIPGTAMPAFGEALAPRDLWALSWYVESLVELRDRPEGRALRERLRSGDDPDARAEPGS